MRRILASLTCSILLAGCTPEETTVPTFPNTPSPTPSHIVAPLPPGVTPAPAVSAEPGPTDADGPETPTCASGWETPETGSRDHAIPLRVIADRLRVDREPVIVEMRMFRGTESPPSDKLYLADITRWYVKLTVPGLPGAQGRFLVEERAFGTGIVAVAPFGSKGFASPDWIGFQFDPSAPALTYPDLPGRWRGDPYDFVLGGEGLEIPGLPGSIEGCLKGS